MIRLAIKVGTQETGIHDGMPVCVLDPSEPLSPHMRKVFAIVDVPDTWEELVRDSLRSAGTRGAADYRPRRRYFALDQLAAALGKPDLEFQWRAPFLVSPVDGSNLNPTLLRSALGVAIPYQPDRNAVSVGTYDVGSGCDYATWAAAAADCTTQTGDLTFVQVSATTETAQTAFSHSIGANVLTLENADRHYGDPTAGFTTTLNDTDADFLVDVTGTGTIDIGGLYFVGSSNLTNTYCLTVAPNFGSGSSATVKVHDLLIDGKGINGGLEVGGGGTGVSYSVWNVVAWDSDTILIHLITSANAITCENCTAYSGNTGFTFTDDAAIIVQNCAAFTNSAGDFSPASPSSAVTTSNASSDTSASGAGSLTSQNVVTEFVTTVDTNAEFMRIASGANQINAGTGALIGDHTKGIRGNSLGSPLDISADSFSSGVPYVIGHDVVICPEYAGFASFGTSEDDPLLSGPAVLDGFAAFGTVVTASPVDIVPVIDTGGAGTGLPAGTIITDNLDVALAVLVTGPFFGGNATIPNTLLPTAQVVGGDFPVTRVVRDTLPDGRRELGLTPDGTYTGTPTLPSTPLTVHMVDATLPDDVENANVPEDGHFLVSNAFSSGPGNAFYDAGAKAGSIGTRRIINPVIYTFRPGDEWEVVWLVEIDALGNRTDRGLYRNEPDDNGEFRWVEYRSMPQRWLDGVLAFEFLDPDQIYDYYAKMLGSVYFEWQLDNENLLDFPDPRACPERLLNFLGESFGLNFTAADSEPVKRARLASAIPTFKATGLELSYLLRLRSLGYIGDIREVWVNPTHVDNWSAYADAPAAIQADIDARGVTIDPDSGEKGQDFIMPPHGFFAEDPAVGVYYPSTRVAVFINEIDGTPLSSSISDADLTVIRDRIAAEFRDDVEPLPVDIRFFGTAFPMADAQDEIEISDAMTFSTVTAFPFHVEILLSPVLSGTLRVTPA